MSVSPSFDIIPELVDIVCDYLTPRDMIITIATCSEFSKNINKLSPDNIKKVLFTKKNYFSSNSHNFEDKTLFSNFNLMRHLIKTENTQLMEYLVINNLYINAYSGFFIISSTNKYYNIMNLLANNNAITNELFNTAFLIACNHGNTGIVQLLGDKFAVNDKYLNSEYDSTFNQLFQNACNYGLLIS